MGTYGRVERLLAAQLLELEGAFCVQSQGQGSESNVGRELPQMISSSHDSRILPQALPSALS